MASELADSYEASDEASENELLDKSLSVWKGWEMAGDDFEPVQHDIHTACSIGHFDYVRSLISRGDLDRKNRGTWTPLMYACYIGHDNIVNLLTEAGCSVNVKNFKGQTPLMLAASCGNETVGKMLVGAGALLEAMDRKGWTALFHATYAGHQNFVRFLLYNRADMNAVEPQTRRTPFMEAAVEGHEIIVQLFLQHGVDVNARDRNGDIARSLALMNGHMKVVSLIDNHVLPISSLRSEPGLDDELSSSDEAYQRPRHHHTARHSRNRSKGPSIHDGPEAIARLIDRSQNQDPGGTHTLHTTDYQNSCVPKGYVTFPQGGQAEETCLSHRDVTSPINPQDYNLDSSGDKDSCHYDDDSNAFSKTGAITIKSSSSSSGGLIAALGLSRDSSIDSDDFCETNQSKQTSKSCDVNTASNTDKYKNNVLTKDKSETTSMRISGDVSPEDVKQNIENWIEDSNGSVINKDEKEVICDKDSGFDRDSQVDKTSEIEWDNNLIHHYNSDSVFDAAVFHKDVVDSPSSAANHTADELDLECARLSGDAQRGTTVSTRDEQLLMGYYLAPRPPDTPAGAWRPVLTEQPSSQYAPQDLVTLLQTLCLTKYLTVFEEQDVDLQVFLSLTDNDLKEIGIKLFGPRKKMTNAIARWHSNAPLSSSSLEQSYADRLEGEMQEMAIQLNQAYAEVDRLKAQVLQEQQLRSVTEGYLMEQQSQVHNVAMDTKHRCEHIKEILKKLRNYFVEIKERFGCVKGQCVEQTRNVKETVTSSLEERHSHQANDAKAVSMEILMKQVESYIKKGQQIVAMVTLNSERLVEKKTEAADKEFTACYS